MRETIKNNLTDPRILEKLYRDNKMSFKKTFNSLYPEIQENTTAQFWNERLNFEQEGITWGSARELVFILIAAFTAGMIARIPFWAGVEEEFFYPRNLAFIFLPMLVIYFAWRNNLPSNRFIGAAVAIIASAIYINLLPGNISTDTLNLACIHMPLFIWAILGFSYTGDQFNNNQRRLNFLSYNGDMMVMTAVLLIAGGILSAVTVGLFSLIQINIEEFYFQNVAIWGLASAPIIGTYLVQTNPQLVNRVSPIVAKIFTPLVLIMLTIYLIAVIYTGKDPYNDREFLMIFNILLIGVMAIILFAITESSKNAESKIITALLFALSIVTIVVNGIALSAILFRIAEWGITPNRLAVLGGNILILSNLLLVTYNLFYALRNKNQADKVASSIASYLPVYVVWTFIVVFLFPLIFGFQ